MNELFGALAYFLVKHYVCDFFRFVQTPWMFLNKGKYLHPGGLVHAGIHSVASLPLYWFLGVPAFGCFILMLFEYVVHYHMDWFKVWFGKKKDWHTQTFEFWEFLGFDQLVHYFTYWVILFTLYKYGVMGA